MDWSQSRRSASLTRAVARPNRAKVGPERATSSKWTRPVSPRWLILRLCLQAGTLLKVSLGRQVLQVPRNVKTTNCVVLQRNDMVYMPTSRACSVDLMDLLLMLCCQPVRCCLEFCCSTLCLTGVDCRFILSVGSQLSSSPPGWITLTTPLVSQRLALRIGGDPAALTFAALSFVTDAGLFASNAYAAADVTRPNMTALARHAGRI